MRGGRHMFILLEIDHHLICTKYFTFIDKYLLLLNGLLGIEQISLSNNTYLPKGNQTDILVIFVNHTTRVDTGLLKTLLVT